MTTLGQRVEPFIWLTGFAALALAVLALAGLAPDPYRQSAHGPLLASLFIAAAVLVARFPVHLTYKTKVYADSAVLTTAAILFDVPWAIAIAAISVALNEAILRDSWEQALFNTAQAALYVGLGSIVFHLLVRLPIAPGIRYAVAVAGCATAMYLLNTMLVATIAARQVGASPWRTLHDMVWVGITEDAVLVLFAGIFAAVARESSWVLPILAVPSAIAYVSLRRSVQAQVMASDALDSLATVVDLRQPTCIGHAERAAALARQLAVRLGLSSAETEDVSAAARLHDVGKILVDSGAGPEPDSEVRPEPRGPQYPTVGADLVGSLSVLANAARYIRHHREHWDGSGYPHGIARGAIPLGARIVGVSDAYDELTVATPDPPGLTPSAALRELMNGAGSRWDPRVVEVLAELIDDHPGGAVR